MLNLYRFIQNKWAVHVLNRALGHEIFDWSPRDVTIRLLPLLEYDNNHHQALPLSSEQSNKIITLNHSDDFDSALRTAQFLFHHYIVLYKKSYSIQEGEISASAHQYLAHLDLNLTPMPEDDKVMMSLLIDMP